METQKERLTKLLLVQFDEKQQAKSIINGFEDAEFNPLKIQRERSIKHTVENWRNIPVMIKFLSEHTDGFLDVEDDDLLLIYEGDETEEEILKRLDWKVTRILREQKEYQEKANELLKQKKELERLLKNINDAINAM